MLLPGGFLKQLLRLLLPRLLLHPNTWLGIHSSHLLPRHIRGTVRSIGSGLLLLLLLKLPQLLSLLVLEVLLHGDARLDDTLGRRLGSSCGRRPMYEDTLMSMAPCR